MLNQLIASRPAVRRSPGGFAASIVLHGVVIVGAIVATASTPATSRRPDPVYLPVFIPAPQPMPPRQPTLAPHAGPVTAVPNIINVPINVPVGLPPIIPLRALINTNDPTEFRVGVSSSAGTPGITPLAPDAAYAVNQVEVAVVLDPRSPLPRFPQLLKDSGVEGMARLQFVVDTLGRVELESVRVVDATHPLFAAAVQATLPRMHFSPARVGNHRVRQLVEFPIEFRISK
ncbi:MAG: TonB family protein [Gemmatimonadaceae bacterium]